MPNSTPLVTVIMPVYNTEQYLDEAIQSILNQTYSHYEFIIVNDGSTDNSPQIIDHYANIESRIIAVHQENKGYITSLNESLKIAKGEFIARMDSDDISVSSRLEKQVDFLTKNPSITVVGSHVKFISSKGVEIGKCKFPTSNREIQNSKYFTSPLDHPVVMFRKDYITQSGGYREIFSAAEDYDLWLRILDTSEIANLSEYLLYHRRHPTSVSILKKAIQANDLNYAAFSAWCREKGFSDPLRHLTNINECINWLGQQKQTYPVHAIRELEIAVSASKAYKELDEGEFLAPLLRIIQLRPYRLYRRSYILLLHHLSDRRNKSLSNVVKFIILTLIIPFLIPFHPRKIGVKNLLLPKIS